MSDNNTNEPLPTGDTNPLSEPAQESLHTHPAAQVGNSSKPKKKKKKKKKATKGGAKTVFSGPTGTPLSASEAPSAEPLIPANSSPVEGNTETAQTVLELPLKPDEWFIEPATYDEDNNILTEETFVFLKEGVEIITMPFTKENFEGLSHILNERFISGKTSTEADYFHIKKPLSDSDEIDPVMTLTQKNRILATTSLDQKTLKQLIRALQKHVQNPNTLPALVKRRWKKHKILRVIFIILSLPVVAMLLYTIFWGLTH